MLEATRAALEGPGSVPWRFGALTGRGMLNNSSEAQQLGRYAEVDGENVALFIAQDRLEDVRKGQIQVGAPDLAAANAVAEDDALYFIVKRVPIEDGLVHMLVLEGGPDA